MNIIFYSNNKHLYIILKKRSSLMFTYYTTYKNITTQMFFSARSSNKNKQTCFFDVNLNQIFKEALQKILVTIKMILNTHYRNLHEIKVLTLSLHRTNVYKICNVYYSRKGNVQLSMRCVTI